jgi:hemolysin activation/secretion protein
MEFGFFKFLAAVNLITISLFLISIETPAPDIGGQGSVRGFKDESIAAKSGFYIQNSLSTNLNQWLGEANDNSQITGTIFFDYGRVYPNSSEFYETQPYALL